MSFPICRTISTSSPDTSSARGEDAAAQIVAQLGERPLREVVERELRQGVAADLGQRQHHNPPQQPARRERPAAEHGVDQGDEGGAAGTTHEPGDDRRCDQSPRAPADEAQETHTLGPPGDADAWAGSRHALSCRARTRTCGSISISPELSPGAL